ncbi:MAG: DNA polymerase I [Planctomycetaceae bacterium]|jgi:DNA polymerase-1|nr:DNA polymerase I [Planctomycetaceae bacterium]
MLTNKTICILDSHGILYQLFHALPPMSSPQGEPVGAVYGFVRDLFTLIEKHKPDYFFCAFDMHGDTFRTEIYKNYKANRPPTPDELRPQIESARLILDAMHIPALGIVGFEADDILATVAHLVKKQNGNCIIITSDKDCRQLISSHVSLYNLRKQTFYRAEELLNDWGITPEQVVDFQALVGDKTDNVPGVQNIGPKTAAELLNTFKNLESIFENVDKITSKKKQENLKNGHNSALLSKELVKLRNDVPIEINWKNAEFKKEYDNEKLKSLFQRFGFKSFLNSFNLNLSDKQETKVNVDSKKHSAASLFDLDSNTDNQVDRVDRVDNKINDKIIADSDNITDSPPQVKFPSSPNYNLVDSIELLDDFINKLSETSIFAFDTETIPIDSRFEATSPRYTNIVGLSFAWKDDEAWYLPFLGPLGSTTLDLKSTLEKLRPILENKAISKIGQNLKYDIVVLRNQGIRLNGMIFDTMIADYLLRTDAINHNLDELAEFYLNHQTIKITDLIGKGKKQRLMNEIQTYFLNKYAGEDALTVWILYPILKSLIETKPAISRLLIELELPLAEILSEMEFVGVTVDTNVLRNLSIRFAKELSELESDIFQLAGHKFNISSPKQLGIVLFEELRLKGVKKTKTSAQSTDIEVLEELALVHPLPAKVSEYRQLAKLKGTYVDALPELIHPVTGRIHSSFNQVSTVTGRLSSSNPNLQNIPVRTSSGREIRKAFKAGTNYNQLLSCDYSQIELRVLAHFSGDERLCGAFWNNEDIHTRVASEVFGVSAENVNSEMRRTAKAVNFGVIYGQTSFGLAKQLGITDKEAQNFIDNYFATYSQIRDYLDSILDNCIKNGYVETLFGRQRKFHEGVIRPQRRGSLTQAERMAINTVIQGTASDLIKQAMVCLATTIPEKLQLKSNLLIQIHDELVYEVTNDCAEQLKEIVTHTMTLNQPLKVPLVVDAELNEHWE